MTGAQLKSVKSDKQVVIGDQLLAGRSEECDLVLTEGHPSRKHASVTVKEDGIWVEDLGSTNGTFVNDKLIEAAVKIEPGDIIRFDTEEYEFVDPTATVVRQAPDPNATVLRSPPPSLPKAAAEKPAPEPAAETTPEPAPPAAAPVEKAEKKAEKPAAKPAPPKETAGAGRRPGAWADPDQAKGGATVLLNSEQIQELLADAKAAPEPLADADAPYLVVTAGARSGTTVKLTAGAQINVWDIGREAERDIVFDEDGVSGFHAKIVNEGARWKIIDQMSSNGTLVNDKRGTISFLSSGDRIRFGPVECVFQLPFTKKSGKAGKTRNAAVSGSSSRNSMVVWGIAAVAVAIAAIAAYILLSG